MSGGKVLEIFHHIPAIPLVIRIPSTKIYPKLQAPRLQIRQQVTRNLSLQLCNSLDPQDKHGIMESTLRWLRSIRI